MTYTPYRGKVEPIVDIKKSEILFHPTHVEIILSYDFQKVTEFGTAVDNVSTAYMFPKAHINITRSSCTHDLDPHDEEVPLVIVDVAGMSDAIWLRCKTNKEADRLYTEFKTYLLKP